MSRRVTGQRIKGKEPILQKIVFELKYRYGFTYLDKCGRTVNTIMREHPEWDLATDQPNPQNAPLVSLRNTCLFNFNIRKYDLSLERPVGENPLSDDEVEVFFEQVDQMSAIVIEQLGLNEFTRIGFRAWYLFGCDSRDDAEAWLRDLGCYSVSSQMINAFDGELDGVGVAVVIRATDRQFRVGFNGVERQALIDVGQGMLHVRPRDLSQGQRKAFLEQERTKARLRRNPEFAAMIDIDAFQEDPEEVDPRDFAETSYRRFLQQLERAVREENE